MFGFSYWFIPLFSGCVWLGKNIARSMHLCTIADMDYRYSRGHDGRLAPERPAALPLDVSQPTQVRKIDLAHSAPRSLTICSAYISDIGATNWGKPLFIAGSAVSVVTFDLVFIAERWLRHRGRLTQNYNMTEKILSICATIAAIVGAAGLILLTIFDTRRYPHVHDAMLVVFM